MQKFHIIGISDDRSVEFPRRTMELINRSRVFSGGRRHHEIVAGILPEGAEWIDITVPLSGVFDAYRWHSDIVVFASGDPLFFGFANTVMRMLPDAEVEVIPSFNSLQMLAHKTLTPYHDMRTLSLTGRPWKALDAALISGEKLMGVLTDRDKTPAAIASRMLCYGYDNYRMVIGECLGNEDERIGEMSLAEAASAQFAMPNCVILKRTAARHRPFGIPEGEFELLDGRARMITKMPVRLLSLSMMDLHNRSVMWDIGFCTGSVSVEARLQFPQLDIVAFEIREAGRRLMEVNSRRFGAPGITAVIGDFMETDLDAYPAPDAVFIGGHGGRLKEMLGRVVPLMPQGGVVVFNSVSDESRELFVSSAEACGLSLDNVVRMSVDDYNTINIMKAVKR